MQEGIRVHPGFGAKSHEGMRFGTLSFLYAIAKSRGQTTAGQAGVVRFGPERKRDLSKGQLQSLETPDRRYGEGRWVDLNRIQV